MLIELIAYGKKLERTLQSPTAELRELELELIRCVFNSGIFSEGRAIELLQDIATAQQIMDAVGIERAKRFSNWRAFKCI